MRKQIMEEKKIDRRKSSWTDRPLTEEERIFAADENNYKRLFYFMRDQKLDPEEWYDILVIPYLETVKKYHEYEPVKQYAFSTILKRKLFAAVSREYRDRKAQKRMPEGGFCSMDYILENDRSINETRIEEWWIDRKTSVEKQVIFKELFQEFYHKCIECEPDCDGWCSWEGGINGYLKCELDLLLEGYTIKQVNHKTEKQYPHGYTVKDLEFDMEGFRRIFKEVFGI